MIPADKPTFWFIGVTTAQSSIMRVFPDWARHLGLGDVAMRGIDLALHDRPERYRAVVRFLKTDPLSRGALVTTHKLDLFAAAHDLFDEIDPHARLMAEPKIALSKRAAADLPCQDPDLVRSWRCDGFLPPDPFRPHRGELFLKWAPRLDHRALAGTLAQVARGANRPARNNRVEPQPRPGSIT